MFGNKKRSLGIEDCEEEKMSRPAMTGVVPRERQDDPTKVAMPRSVVFTQPCDWSCMAFCSTA